MNEALRPSLEKIRDGINEFNEAVTARFNSGDYRSTHLHQINTLRIKLLQIVAEVVQLRNETQD